MKHRCGRNPFNSAPKANAMPALVHSQHFQVQCHRARQYKCATCKILFIHAISARQRESRTRELVMTTCTSMWMFMHSPAGREKPATLRQACTLTCTHTHTLPTMVTGRARVYVYWLLDRGGQCTFDWRTRRADARRLPHHTSYGCRVVVLRVDLRVRRQSAI